MTKRLATVPTRAKMAQLVSVMNKLAGLPKRSTAAGRGPHATIADSPPGIGWTTSLAIPIRRLDGGAYAVELTPKVLPYFRGAMASLTQRERDWLAAEVTEIDIADDDPEWFEVIDDDPVFPPRRRAVQEKIDPAPVPARSGGKRQ